MTLHLSNILAKVWCPDTSQLEAVKVQKETTLRQIRYRLPPPSDSQHLPLPKFFIPLETLHIRTTKRYPIHYGGKVPLTEMTDYGIVLDAERDSMPVWIMCSRRQLQERVEGEGRDTPQLPIFGGGMQNEDFGYDTACILESVHQLGSQPLDFQAACDLVRRTRAVADPASLSGVDLRMKMEELGGGAVSAAGDRAELSVDGAVIAGDESLRAETLGNGARR